jgi:hypothetical protein
MAIYAQKGYCSSQAGSFISVNKGMVFCNNSIGVGTLIFLSMGI